MKDLANEATIQISKSSRKSYMRETKFCISAFNEKFLKTKVALETLERRIFRYMLVAMIKLNS